MGQLTVLGAVLVHIGIQQDHGHAVAGSAFDRIEPGAYPDLPSLQFDGDLGAQGLGVLLGLPRIGVFHLAALEIDLLTQVPKATDQGDADHGQADIGGGAQGVAR